MDWDDYYDHDTLNEFIDSLASANADFAKIINIGQSYEGRDMNVLAMKYLLKIIAQSRNYFNILDYSVGCVQADTYLNFLFMRLV